MRKKVVIIGAGPAGILLANYLLRRGNYNLEIYERRSDPRSLDFNSDRTFPISLQERGRKALRQIEGLEAAIANQGTFCNGTFVHQRNGKVRRIFRKHPTLTIDRNRLVAVLLEQLFEKYNSHQVRVYFNHQCIQVNPRIKTVTLQTEEGGILTVKYDLLVGADGAGSVIRDCLQQDGELQGEQTYVADAYKSVFLPRINQQLNIELEPNTIHTYNRDVRQRMIMVSQPNERLNGVFIFAADNNPFLQMKTKEDVLTFFRQNFPPFGKLMLPEEAEALLQRPVARVVTVSCDRFHYTDSILLLGDAAHAVSPSLGQGCNSALEDVLIFVQLLDKFGDDWSQTLPEFTKIRLPDARSLRELSDYSFPRSKLLIFEFFVRLISQRILHKIFPQWFKPFVFDLVFETDLPYSEVLRLSQGWIAKVKRLTPNYTKSG